MKKRAMNAEDASNRVDATDAKPPRVRDKRFDDYLKGAGLTLAAVCAILPFVMYYDILDARTEPQSTGKAVRDPLDRTNQKVVRETRAKQEAAAVLIADGIDPMTTATTAEQTSDRLKKSDEAKSQPFPDKPVFLVREVVGGLVMIEDEAGYWFVEKGSMLPDGTTLVAIERGSEPGSVSIKTSDGTVINRTN